MRWQCGLKIILRTLYVHLKSVSNLILGESSRYLWRIAEEIELVRVITWAEVLELSYNFCQLQKFIATHRVMLGSQIHRIHWWCFGMVIILMFKPSQIWSFQKLPLSSWWSNQSGYSVNSLISDHSVQMSQGLLCCYFFNVTHLVLVSLKVTQSVTWSVVTYWAVRDS